MNDDTCMQTVRTARLLTVMTAVSLAWIVWQGTAAVTAGDGAPSRATKEETGRSTAAAWAVKGWELIRLEAYPRAADAFTRAIKLDGSEPSFLVGLGVSRHRLHEDESAVAALERALLLDPNVGQAHALLGDIYERRGESMAARRHYETALRQDPNDVVVRERLLGITREAGIDVQRDRLFSAHFVVLFQGTQGRTLAHQAADRLEQAYGRIGLLLSYLPAESFTVILYPERQFQTMTQSPGWTRGMFDGRIHLPAEALAREPGAVSRILDHEYVHAVVYRLSGGHAPTWLDEGLARYGEEGGGAGDGRVSSQDRESLYGLHGDFMSLPRHNATVAYEQSLGATRALIKRHGLAQVRRLLEALLITPNFSRTFEAVFQERYSDFNRMWILSNGEPNG